LAGEFVLAQAFGIAHQVGLAVLDEFGDAGVVGDVEFGSDDEDVAQVADEGVAEDGVGVGELGGDAVDTIEHAGHDLLAGLGGGAVHVALDVGADLGDTHIIEVGHGEVGGAGNRRGEQGEAELAADLAGQRVVFLAEFAVVDDARFFEHFVVTQSEVIGQSVEALLEAVEEGAVFLEARGRQEVAELRDNSVPLVEAVFGVDGIAAQLGEGRDEARGPQLGDPLAGFFAEVVLVFHLVGEFLVGLRLADHGDGGLDDEDAGLDVVHSGVFSVQCSVGSGAELAVGDAPTGKLQCALVKERVVAVANPGVVALDVQGGLQVLQGKGFPQRPVIGESDEAFEHRAGDFHRFCKKVCWRRAFCPPASNTVRAGCRR